MQGEGPQDEAVCDVVSHSVMADSLCPHIACWALLSLVFSMEEYWRVPMPSSRGSFQPRDQTQVPTLQVDSLLSESLESPR